MHGPRPGRPRGDQAARLQVGPPGPETFPGRVGGGWPVGGRKRCLVADRRAIQQRGVVLPVEEGAGGRTARARAGARSPARIPADAPLPQVGDSRGLPRPVPCPFVPPTRPPAHPPRRGLQGPPRASALATSLARPRRASLPHPFKPFQPSEWTALSPSLPAGKCQYRFVACWNASCTPLGVHRQTASAAASAVGRRAEPKPRSRAGRPSSAGARYAPVLIDPCGHGPIQATPSRTRAPSSPERA